MLLGVKEKNKARREASQEKINQHQKKEDRKTNIYTTSKAMQLIRSFYLKFLKQ